MNAQLGALATYTAIATLISAPARGSDCAGALSVSAPAELATALRAALAGSELRELPAAQCGKVHIELARTQDRLIVMLAMPNQATARQVSSVSDAAFWIEAWLEPALGTAASAAPERDRPAQPPPSLLPSPAPPPALLPNRAATLGVAARSALDTDGAHWNGIEVYAELAVVEPLWLGVGLGRSWDYVLGRSALGRSVERTTTHALVRVGGAWPLSERSEWSIGLGTGVMSAFARGVPLAGGNPTSDSEGAGLLELASALHFRPAPHVVLRLALEVEHSIELERADPQEAHEPLARVDPSWRAGVAFGIGLSFGGP